jgi:hypothetical protein
MATALSFESDPTLTQGYIKVNGTTVATITETAINAPITGNITGNVTGNITGNVTGNVTGNADTATQFQTARTIAISGAVTGTATSFNGGSNISIPATITSGATITSPAFAGTATGSLTSGVIQGVTDGSLTSAAGVVGELLSGSTTAASIISSTTTNGATVTLTAGNWELFGNATFNFNSVTVTANSTIAASVGTASGTLTADQQQVVLLGAYSSATASPAFALVTPRVNISVTTSTPVYLVVKSPQIAAGTMTFSSVIRARRVR